MDMTRKRASHGEATRRRTYIYSLWRSIKTRCYNEKDPNYAQYGARGITVHSVWIDNYVQFARYIRETIGERPTGHTLDRTDNNKGYEPGNLRWATMGQQSRNRRSNRTITFRGQTMIVAEWAEMLGLCRNTLLSRLNQRGWPIERALTTPTRKHKPYTSRDQHA
jgi:hypothetical protein